MPKPNNKEAILEAGLTVFHQHGFHGSSVNDVVSHAGIPKGSFYNHYATKETLGCAVIEQYWENTEEIRSLLQDSTLAPLERLEHHLTTLGYREQGCLIGNFSAELADNDLIRERLHTVFQAWTQEIVVCIAAGQQDGSIRTDSTATELAQMVIASYEGSLLAARVARNPEQMNTFRKTLLTLLNGNPDNKERNQDGNTSK